MPAVRHKYTGTDIDAQAAVASGGELVVWAMEDSLLLRETVNTYASEHPEQTVTVEYGQDSLDNGMTVDDVIRTLNVEIFAGEGPDVLVLDSIPVESYIRQRMLADFSNFDTSNCYENIVHCYADESGCLVTAAAVPPQPGLLPV